MKQKFIIYNNFIKSLIAFNLSNIIKKNKYLFIFLLFGGITIPKLVSLIINYFKKIFSKERKTLKELENNKNGSKNYEEWSFYNKQVVNIENKNKIIDIDNLYSKDFIENKVKHLKKIFDEKREVDELMIYLREDLIRNIGNIQNQDIYEKNSFIPKPILEYIEEIIFQLDYIVHEHQYPINKKLSFFQESRHTYGRTALMLSGGGSLGTYHLGVIKALRDQNLLPRIISGSSVGSIIASIICCYDDSKINYLLDNLEEVNLNFFSSNKLTDFLGHFIMKGHVHDQEHLKERLIDLIGNYTFLEAYEKTGRILNIVVTPHGVKEPTRVLNFLTAPHVLVWSAVLNSSSMPFLFPPGNIEAKNKNGEIIEFSLNNGQKRYWKDGSLEKDLPLKTMCEMFNVNYFIVSQVNPHISPILYLKKSVNKRVINLFESEFKHRCKQINILFPNWNITQLTKLLSQSWEGDVTMNMPLKGYFTSIKSGQLFTINCDHFKRNCPRFGRLHFDWRASNFHQK